MKLEEEMGNMRLNKPTGLFEENQQKSNQFDRHGDFKNQRVGKQNPSDSGMNGIMNHANAGNSSQSLKEDEYRITKNKNDRFDEQEFGVRRTQQTELRSTP